MEKTDYVKMLARGVGFWNEWRDTFEGEGWPDLSEADLSGVDLQRANLRRVDLSSAILFKANLNQANLVESLLAGAYLVEANLREADVRQADLTGTNLQWANLVDANFNDAILRGANLGDTILVRTSFIGANLSDADFSGADMGFTAFGNCDLSTVKGLEAVEHVGPSTIGIDTLFSSDGKIPDLFLRGVGVPEDFITYAPSLVGQAIEFYSCFISFSHEDSEFAQRLHSRMRSAHLRVWYAPEDMKGGKKLHEEIFRAIQIHDKLLLVLSESSMKSEWVASEIRRARRIEREENRRKLFPIRLVDFDAIKKWECFDADGGNDLAIELREYYIPDFSNWKDHDAFEAEFAKLFRGLKA